MAHYLYDRFIQPLAYVERNPLPRKDDTLQYLPIARGHGLEHLLPDILAKMLDHEFLSRLQDQTFDLHLSKPPNR
jgi:hypothetical protein